MADYHIYYMSFTTCEYSGGTCVYGAQAVYDKPGANGSCTSNSSASVTAAKSSGLLTAVYEARAPFESFQPMTGGGLPLGRFKVQIGLTTRMKSDDRSIHVPRGVHVHVPSADTDWIRWATVAVWPDNDLPAWLLDDRSHEMLLRELNPDVIDWAHGLAADRAEFMRSRGIVRFYIKTKILKIGNEDSSMILQ